MASALPLKSYARIPVKFDLPNLIEVQLEILLSASSVKDWLTFSTKSRQSNPTTRE